MKLLNANNVVSDAHMTDISASGVDMRCYNRRMQNGLVMTNIGNNPELVVTSSNGRQILTIKNIDSCIQDNTSPLSPIASDRLATIATDSEIMRKADSGLSLLIHIVVLCGDGDTCQICATEFSNLFKCHRNTLGNWSKKLQQEGFITIDERDGNKGVTVKLNTEVIKSSGLFADIKDIFARLVECAGGLRQISNMMIDKMFSELMKGRNKVA